MAEVIISRGLKVIFLEIFMKSNPLFGTIHGLHLVCNSHVFEFCRFLCIKQSSLLVAGSAIPEVGFACM